MTSHVASPAPGPRVRLLFDGRASEMAAIFLKNMLLSIPTLGLYRYWGRVRVRRYLWQHLSVGGHRLTYTGTGGELFRGALRLVGVLVLVGATVVGIESALPSPWAPLVGAGIALLLAPPASYLARRYRLSRTRLCNIPLGMHPVLMDFWRLSLRGTFMSWVTLGWAWPTFAERRQAFLVEHTYSCGETLRYAGDPAKVRRILLRSLPWMLLTLGVHGFWLSASLARHRAQATRVGEARLALDYSGGQSLLLLLTSTLATLCTFGLALPWVICRSTRFFAEHFWFEGRLPVVSAAPMLSNPSATFDGDDLGLEF